ncbi:MAG: hypothetical protein PHY48_17225 [Candidatus Cloacimonetes bacterium]|nr:hypothetical protein [Candidatus Cloacimonadota bacterium]
MLRKCKSERKLLKFRVKDNKSRGREVEMYDVEQGSNPAEGGRVEK